MIAAGLTGEDGFAHVFAHVALLCILVMVLYDYANGALTHDETLIMVIFVEETLNVGVVVEILRSIFSHLRAKVLKCLRIVASS